MIITLYLYTSRNSDLYFGPQDLEEEESIKKTVREHVIPDLGCNPEPIEYETIDGGKHMKVTLYKSGSRKNSVIAKTKKNLDKMVHDWARLYNYDILVDKQDRQACPDKVTSMTVIDIMKKGEK